VSGRYGFVLYKKCIFFLVSFNGAEFPMRNQKRSASPPNTVNCTVRKYLTAREIEKLMDYARKHSRYGHRDLTMVLVTYRHGLRASEVCDLQWHQVELDQGRMHVRRAKNGTPSPARVGCCSMLYGGSRCRRLSPARLWLRFGLGCRDCPCASPRLCGRGRRRT
jgi:hypothetical protein